MTTAEWVRQALRTERERSSGPTSGDKLAAVLAVVDEVHVVDAAAVHAARRLLDRVDGLSARDAIHLAIMGRHGIDDILTFDAGFDTVTWIRRLPR